jgi:hypothetical protein
MDEQRNEIEVFQECLEDLKKFIHKRNTSRIHLKKTIDLYNSMMQQDTDAGTRQRKLGQLK